MDDLRSNKTDIFLAWSWLVVSIIFILTAPWLFSNSWQVQVSRYAQMASGILLLVLVWRRDPEKRKKITYVIAFIIGTLLLFWALFNLLFPM